MSASEKLKALERRIEEHGSPDNDLHGEDLLLALPQIVAVVEAAEDEPFTVDWQLGEVYRSGRLTEALRALEEALS